MRLIYASDLKLYIMRHLLIDEDSTPEEIERQMLRAIDVQPAIDADVVRHGHWIMNEYDELYCSVCGYIASLDSGEYFYRGKIRFDDSFYCPNCGAKMDEVSE